VDGCAPELLVWALVGLASVEASVGDAERAARLVGAVEAVTERMSYVLRSNQLDRQERTIEALRERLGDSDLERARAEGRRLSDEDAIAYAVAPEGVGA
jgi:hypothetical protein